MSEKNSFFSLDALWKNICVSFAFLNWMNYTFLMGWEKYNPGILEKVKIVLANMGFMRLMAIVYKEIFFSLDPLSIFMKGLLVQISFVQKAVKALFPLILLLAVIYFFYYKKNNY